VAAIVGGRPWCELGQLLDGVASIRRVVALHLLLQDVERGEDVVPERGPLQRPVGAGIPGEAVTDDRLVQRLTEPVVPPAKFAFGRLDPLLEFVGDRRGPGEVGHWSEGLRPRVLRRDHQTDTPATRPARVTVGADGVRHRHEQRDEVDVTGGDRRVVPQRNGDSPDWPVDGIAAQQQIVDIGDTGGLKSDGTQAHVVAE
jgi:hypothetical protein